MAITYSKQALKYLRKIPRARAETCPPAKPCRLSYCDVNSILYFNLWYRGGVVIIEGQSGITQQQIRSVHLS